MKSGLKQFGLLLYIIMLEAQGCSTIPVRQATTIPVPEATTTSVPAATTTSVPEATTIPVRKAMTTLVPEAIQRHYAPAKIETGILLVTAPGRAIDVVPVWVDWSGLQDPREFVTEIAIYYERKPGDRVASFTFSPDDFTTSVALRLSLPRSDVVHVIARLNSGRVLAASVRIEIIQVSRLEGRSSADSPGAVLAPQHASVFAQPERERYGEIATNPVQRVSEQPVSTFSVDVDTGSYSNVRRFVHRGRLPPSDAVRVEEMMNYFQYTDVEPATRDVPFSVTTELATSPWHAGRQLMRIGLKAYELDRKSLPPANLVFLIDVSGSMTPSNKLPLLVASLKLLTRQLRDIDHVSIVVYAGASGVVLEPTPGNRKEAILPALDRLQAGGSTNGGAGIRLAYALARQVYQHGGINRLILATDGDFNVGTVSHNELIDLVERERESGITLTTLGFGEGNINEKLMEQLANRGNGNYAYIDSLREARKVLVEQLTGTLAVVAKDVKIQVHFNPATVAEYRLIGYENRLLKREDFSNDKVDAGEIGAGHAVTALYEIVPVGGAYFIEPSPYEATPARPDGRPDELATVRLRYKLSDGIASQLLERTVKRDGPASSIQIASENMRFAAAVAAYGQLLRGGQYLGQYDYQDVLALARMSMQHDPSGRRREFVELVELTAALEKREVSPSDGANVHREGQRP